MGVGQLSESDAVDALRLPFYSSRHARGSHVPGNQFDLGNTRLTHRTVRFWFGLGKTIAKPDCDPILC